jgi:hypothetical protein
MIIYQSKKYDPEKHGWLAASFSPVFDTTDHFHFACDECKEIATILQVERNDSYANTPTIRLLMLCPKCEKCGLRKIYLEDAGKHFLSFPKFIELLAKKPKEANAGIIKRP